MGLRVSFPFVCVIHSVMLPQCFQVGNILHVHVTNIYSLFALSFTRRAEEVKEIKSLCFECHSNIFHFDVCVCVSVGDVVLYEIFRLKVSMSPIIKFLTIQLMKFIAR